MLYKINTKDERVAGFRWEGVFDKRSLKEAFGGLLPDIRSRKKINLYLEVSEINRPEEDDFLRDLQDTFDLFEDIEENIDRISLVSDEGWLQDLAENYSNKFGSIELRSFGFDQKGIAMDFVCPH